MTDAELVARRLALLETYVQELVDSGRPERITEDLKEERFIVHTVQLAAQAAIDVASHIVSDERLGEPASNRALFELLGESGWLPRELAASLAKMARFRNVVVHGYEIVDLAIVRDLVENRLGDLVAFAAAIRRGLA